MTVTIKQGHVLDVLAKMPARSVHCVVCSPPYWGLRSYGTPPQVWETGNECACKGEHEWGDPITDKKRGQAAGDTARVGNTQKRVCPPETQQGQYCVRECGCEWETAGGRRVQPSVSGSTSLSGGAPPDKAIRGDGLSAGAFCRRGCGAWRGELGSEPTLDLFVAHLVEVFAAVGRVLRDDGTLWVNLGDSYAGGGGGNYGEGKSIVGREGVHHTNEKNRPGWLSDNGLKPGDLCMVPARFALAMQAASWTLRSQIVLPKRAPMPESIQGSRWERCRVKLAKNKAVDPLGRGGQQQMLENPERHAGVNPDWLAEWADCPGCAKCDHPDPEQRGYVQRWGSGRPTSAYEVLYVLTKGMGHYFWDTEAVRQPVSAATLADGRTARGQQGTKGEYGTVDGNAGYNPAGRNLWNYVMWAPEPLAQAHYAAFPRFIPRLAIQAGTSERGVCPDCGAPWLRVVNRPSAPPDVFTDRNAPTDNHVYAGSRVGGEMKGQGQKLQTWRDANPSQTLGWRQSCRCAPHQPTPSTVLDPFAGSGTTLIEANALGRHGIGVELNSSYCDIAERRLGGQPLSLFAWEGEPNAAG